jgi:hypothetical protein
MPAHRPRAAGGLPIALGVTGGAALGFVQGQPTLFLLAGFSIGVVIALLIWLFTR